MDNRRAVDDPARLRRIDAALARRGPDGAGHWVDPDGRIALVHRRLAVLGPGPQGAQPMLWPTSSETTPASHALVYNGEIYNHRQIAAQLRKEGTHPNPDSTSDSDTETLLALLMARGPEAVFSLCRGMYAFAYWDARRGALALARDPLGIKPLHWGVGGSMGSEGLFGFGSTPAAVVAALGPRSPDPIGWAAFLSLGWIPPPHGPHRGIQALEPGHLLWVDESGPRPARSILTMGHMLQTAAATPVTDRRPVLAEAVQDSVQAHLLSDRPVGLLLSGGVDSSVLAAMTPATQASDMLGLTLAFDPLPPHGADERDQAAEVAGLYGLAHHACRADRDRFLAVRADLLAQADPPSIDGINQYLICAQAAKLDRRVLLSGAGGDELTQGYAGMHQVPRLVHGLARFAGLPGFDSLSIGLRHLLRHPAAWAGKPKAAGLAEYGRSFSDAWLLRRNLFAPWELSEVMEPQAARIGWEGLDLRARLARSIAPLRNAGEPLLMTALEAQWYLPGQLLSTADWAGMAHGVEIRVPLVDVDLYRVVLQLIAGSAPDKADLANAPAQVQPPRPPLPDSVASGRKIGFGTPIGQWLESPSARATKRPASGGQGLRRWGLEIMAHHAPDLLAARPGAEQEIRP